MRAIANTKSSVDGTVRCMLYTFEHGTYLFLYKTLRDGPCQADLFFESMDDALDLCRLDYDVQDSDWTSIEDPDPGCQDDWIATVRVKLDPHGTKLWGAFERRVDDNWVEIPSTAFDMPP